MKDKNKNKNRDFDKPEIIAPATRQTNDPLELTCFSSGIFFEL
jgi:hypothetical protein